MTATLVPIFLCVVLPVAIVLITSLTKVNADNKRTQILIKAIEANKDVDTEKLMESLRAPRKTAREILNARLQRGCMYSLIGLALLTVGIASLANGTEFEDDSVFFSMIFSGIAIAIGISYLITYFATRKQVDTNPEK